MDFSDIAIVAIIFLFSFIFSSASKKGSGKKNKAGNKQSAAPAKGRTAGAADKMKRAVQSDAREQAVSAAREGADPCHDYMLSPMEEQMHYEAHSADEMAEAGEGEDPCHVGSAAKPQEEQKEPGASPPELSPVARAIIMSEVLKRPSQRRQERQMRHRKAMYG